MLPLLIFHVIVFGLLVVLSIVFFCGKGTFLIAGYNTSSKEEKNHINEKLLCRFMGKLMLILAGCWFVVALGSIFDITFLLVVGIILFFIAIAGATVYANTGDRFK